MQPMRGAGQSSGIWGELREGVDGCRSAKLGHSCGKSPRPSSIDITSQTLCPNLW